MDSGNSNIVSGYCTVLCRKRKCDLEAIPNRADVWTGFWVNLSRERGNTHGFLLPPRVLYGFPHGARIQSGLDLTRDSTSEYSAQSHTSSGTRSPRFDRLGVLTALPARIPTRSGSRDKKIMLWDVRVWAATVRVVTAKGSESLRHPLCY